MTPSGHVLGDLLAAQGEDLLLAGHLRGDDRAGRDRAVVGRLADLGVLQGLLELMMRASLSPASSRAA